MQQAGTSQESVHQTNSLPDGGSSYPMIRAKMSGSSSSLSSPTSSSSSYDPLIESDEDENEDDVSDTKSTNSSSSSTPRARIPSPVPEPSYPMPEWSMVSDTFEHNFDWGIPSPRPLPPLPGDGGSFEPNRIPASVFATRGGNATDWSVASNESLFSIHMENNSFSRDNAFLNNKSGELHKGDDYIRPSSDVKSPEMNIFLPPRPTLHEVDVKKGSSTVEASKIAEIDSPKSSVDSPKEALLEAGFDSPKSVDDSPKKHFKEGEFDSPKSVDSPKKHFKEGETDSPKKVDSPKKHLNEAETDSPKKHLKEAEIDSPKSADSPKKRLKEDEIDSPKKVDSPKKNSKEVEIDSPEKEVDSPKKNLKEVEVESPKKEVDSPKVLKEAEVDSPNKGLKEAENDSPKKVVKETPHFPPVNESEVHGNDKVAGLSVSDSNVSDCKGRQSADTTRTSGSTARLSDVSANSSYSFAFPVLTSDAGKNVSAIPIPEHTTPPKPPEKPVYQPPQPPQETQVKKSKEESIKKPPPINRWVLCCPCSASCC